MATLGGPNRLLNSAEVGELLGLPERTIRAEWKRWGRNRQDVVRQRAGRNMGVTTGAVG
jgi:hypothetical protein